MSPRSSRSPALAAVSVCTQSSGLCLSIHARAVEHATRPGASSTVGNAPPCNNTGNDKVETVFSPAVADARES
eukprot:scaffold71486_cov30-Tisochrysis_lutea.AAC.2